jgi:pantothenate kinase type III
MNLVLDIGNTRVKAAVFKEDKLVDHWVWERSAALKNTEDIIFSIVNCKRYGGICGRRI